VLGGDETAELAAAFMGLAERLRQVREPQNKQFADLLAGWNKAPTVTDEVIPIEQALSQIVAKLARSTPLLLLIVGGMSHAVFRELSDDLRDLYASHCPNAERLLRLADDPYIADLSVAVAGALGGKIGITPSTTVVSMV
jgi:hypothetical protein